MFENDARILVTVEAGEESPVVELHGNFGDLCKLVAFQAMYIAKDLYNNGYSFDDTWEELKKAITVGINAVEATTIKQEETEKGE